ncbi:MAG: S9 family peptidase, partial [Verrucomicrobia bacterium]|nr:S9 family peptidase [Verrucomicrobiota bacterium]
MNLARVSLTLAAMIAVFTPSVLCAVKYPETRKSGEVDVLHGVRVEDAYRWLEDDNAAETKAWVEAQNKVTFGWLGEIQQRDAIRKRLTRLWNFERYGVPSKAGSRYFLSKNDGLQNQSVLYTLESLSSEPRVLLDPNKLSKDGTVALAGAKASWDGKLLAYATASAGSDWNEWKVRDTSTGEDLSDHLKWVKFSGASWTRDNRGFFYSRYDEPKPGENLKGVNYYHKLYYHRIGTPQSEDRLVYQRQDQKEWGFSGEVTEDGRYLLIHVSQGTSPKNRVFYQDLQKPDAPVVELLNDFDASYDFISNDGPVFWFLTDLHAPRGRVIAIDIRNPVRSQWKELISMSSETLQRVGVVNEQFVCGYLKDARTVVKVYSLDGRHVRDVDLPGIGTASGFDGERKDSETFYSFTGFTTPGVIYRYDMKTGTSTVFRQPKADFDPELFETRQVFYASKDGTKIPMFITSKKGVKLDGRNPVLLYGYGGFNISLTPSFSVSTMVWLEMGGVYAVPNLRGGGEYGEEWHQAGTRLKKQNVFDDFIAAA